MEPGEASCQNARGQALGILHGRWCPGCEGRLLGCLMTVACLLFLGLPSEEHRGTLVHTETLAEGTVGADTPKGTVKEKPHKAGFRLAKE